MPDPIPDAAGKPPGAFAWVLPALKNRRTIKTWIRCCIALCVSLVLMVGNKTLVSLGQAGFFAAIIAVMLPPSMALSLFILAIITLLLGMCFGWAWGAAAMAAANAARSAALLAKQQKEAQASLVQGVSTTLQYQKFIFEGKFLDPRSTGVYAVFFFVGTFFLGALRAFVPKLALLSIFGTIVIDIMCSYGPLFPAPQYTLAKTFLVPTAYYVAVAIATLIFIFPESLNHVWLTSLRNDVLAPVEKILESQTKSLEIVPSDQEKWNTLTQQSGGARQALIAGSQALAGQIGLTDLEFSVGRLGPNDLKRINAELKSLTFRSLALHAFQLFVNGINDMDTKAEVASFAAASNDEKLAASTLDRFTALSAKIKDREAKHGHDLDSLVPLLAIASKDVRDSSQAAMKCISTWIHDCNSGRWTGFFSKLDEAKSQEKHAALVSQVEELKNALQQFRDVKRHELTRPFERFFDPEHGGLKSGKGHEDEEMFASRSLFVCFVFSFAVDAFADRLIKFLNVVIDLDTKRRKPKIWAPSGFRKIGKKLRSRRDVDRQVVPLADGTSQDPTSFEISRDDLDDLDDDDERKEELLEEDKPCRRNPDALPPTSAFGKFFVKLGQVLRFFKSPEGIFSLRHAVVSIALWIPAILPRTAWFTYVNRGLWALIMAQTGLAVYAGDQIAGFFIRIAGTILGLLLGVAAWYIGAPGHATGNPYGIVIITTAFIAPFIFFRLAAPPQQMMFWTMTSVTIVFVVGYSWVDTHLPLLVNSGVGIGLGWKRALLVIIGFAAGFVVMMFPRPTSSRTLVRQTLAATTNELGHILASEVEALLAEEAKARVGIHEKVEFVGDDADKKASLKELRVRRIGQRIFNVATRLQGLAPALKTAQFEPQCSGIWPHEKYEALYAAQMKILFSLVLFTGAFTQLDTKWCSILVHQTPFLNPNLLSDIFSNISVLSYALAGGHPLPPSLSKLRDRVVYHERSAPRTPANKSLFNLANSRVLEEDLPDLPTDRIDGSSMGFEELKLEILQDEQFPSHSAALVALSHAISRIDEVTEIIRDLCGEVSFRGFDQLYLDFLRKEEAAVGASYSQKMRMRSSLD